VLDEASRLLSGWTCPSSTDCCRFAVTGREPSLTRAEWDAVVVAIKRSGRRLPDIPPDGTCPLLTADGRCSVYAARPLGCRTYYGEKASGPPVDVRALRTLVHDLERASDGEKGRPLRSWLAEATARGGRRPRAAARP
jgi:uncharacterized protein